MPIWRRISTRSKPVAELVITRQNREPMVIMALSEWEGMRETLHLLGSPTNAERLRRSTAALDAGKGQTHDLIGE